jgi:hypothetical protein
MARRGYRTLEGRTRPMLASLKLITGRCAKYYETESVDERRALVQDIWRYANFAIMAESAKRRRARRKPKPKKLDGRVRPRRNRRTVLRNSLE